MSVQSSQSTCDFQITEGSGRIVHFTDLHAALPVENQGDYIDVKPEIMYGKDPSIELLKPALQCAKQAVPEPDIFLYTGDSVIQEAKMNQ